MTKLLAVLLFIISSHLTYAQVGFQMVDLSKADLLSPTPMPPDEVWIRLTCFGTTTPSGVYPIVEKEVTRFHIELDKEEVFPSIKEIRDLDHTRIFNYSTLCTDRRRAMMDLTGFTGMWLDWYSDHGYQRLAMEDVVVTDGNACRPLGNPCHQTSECCALPLDLPRIRGAKLSCHELTKTCEYRNEN